MSQLSTWFKALSEDLRLEILSLLLRHESLCVCEVESLLEVSQSTASRHLRYLQRAGLVDSHREGLWVYYRLAEPGSGRHRQLIAMLEPLLSAIPLRDLTVDLAAMRASRACAPGDDRRSVVSRSAEEQGQNA